MLYSAQRRSDTQPVPEASGPAGASADGTEVRKWRSGYSWSTGRAVPRPGCCLDHCAWVPSGSEVSLSSLMNLGHLSTHNYGRVQLPRQSAGVACSKQSKHSGHPALSRSMTAVCSSCLCTQPSRAHTGCRAEAPQHGPSACGWGCNEQL